MDENLNSATVERRLSGYILSSCTFICDFEKLQFNTKIALRVEEEI